MSRSPIRRLLLAAAVIVLMTVQVQAQSPAPTGIIATFDVNGETFRVLVTNPTTIQQIRDLQAGTATANIPNGRILRGSGPGDYNAPWNWYLDPQDISMADFTIELCDGAPSYVEENIAYFVDTVGRYCPWSAKLVSIQDVQSAPPAGKPGNNQQTGGNEQNNGKPREHAPGAATPQVPIKMPQTGGGGAR